MKEEHKVRVSVTKERIQMSIDSNQVPQKRYIPGEQVVLTAREI